MKWLSLALIRQRYADDGGAERFVARLLQTMQGKEVRVTLVTRAWRGAAGVDVLTVNPFYLGRTWRDWSFARAVRRRLAAHVFDIVQSHERIAGCDIYRAGDGVHREWLRQRAHVLGPVGRLSQRLSPYHIYTCWAERRMFHSPKLRAVVCNSQMVKEEIKQNFGVPDERIHVIRTGVDANRYHPNLRRHRSDVRIRLQIHSDSVVFLFVGSGFERKGLAAALAALAEVPDAHMMVVGRDRRLEKLRRQAVRLGVIDRVHFEGAQPDVRPYYGAADALVLPTLYDPFPNVVLEAMASGLPVITSTKCGAAEMIGEGKSGFVCDALDVRALADALKQMLSNERRARMGVAAREKVETFGIEPMADQFLALYQACREGSDRLHIVHTESSRGWGGQEIRILTEAQGMIQRGHRVEVWAPPDSNIYVEAGRRNIPHRSLPIGRKNVRGLFAMRRALAHTRPDVVNTHSSTDAWLAALASLTLRAPPPMVRTRHISSPVPTNSATRWLYNHATRHVVTTGERLRQTLLRDNRLREGRITSIPTGVAIERFFPGDKLQARQSLGLEPSARYIGIVATLRSWKGHLYLLEAFAQLAAEDDRRRLVIVGDGPMLSALQERAEALGISAKVVFAGRQEAVERWLQAFDVFCLPSYANEGVPQALMQAMLTGLPIVTTPVGSIEEAVVDGVTAILVPPKDVDALTAALRRLLTDEVHTPRLGAVAREQAQRRFATAPMLSAMEAVLRHVVVANAKRPRGTRARWRRLRRSLERRWTEWRLPRGYVRLGTRYGGWWVDRRALTRAPLVIDCGLGRDISFPTEMLTRFGATVIGIEPNPESLDYCRAHCPSGMQIVQRAFWTEPDRSLTFHLPRAKERLPGGADGVSGSILESHDYVSGGDTLTVTTTSLEQVLAHAGRTECDVLKLDIEGAEYDVLDDLCSRGQLPHVRQLLVEFHHDVTIRSGADTEAIVARIAQAGFRLMHTEGRNYIFRRADFG